ncbi:MAG TPA: cation:proton antiporter [Fluviicola sp.]|nr:cation:proton antiporter [Fluviicola sp.]
MQHLPPLIYDLALVLIAAAVISLIFKWLRQPVVLGYIIAGFFVGPNFNVFPSVVEIDSVKIWAEIGVLFLLFGLGLEFSFKKLLKVGGVAVITALMGVGMTMLVGFFIGKLFLGWANMDCLFLGGILAIASTTIIIRAFDELGVKSQKFSGIVMGVLVVEDIVAVVLMVILSTVSISREFEGMEMIVSVLKLLFFLILWFLSGIYILPSLLKRLRRLLSEETLLIVSLALCFLMVVLATMAGFSPALGAFIMGSILAETTKAEKIEHVLKPLQSLFGAIFFVSVGMLIDPKMLLTHALPIGLATLVLLFGKPFFVTLGALVSGQPLKVAVQSGMSLSQIGEFSFIIATLGLTLDVTSDFLYPIAVAVSVITTFTTPFMIRLSEPFYKFLEKRLPKKWMDKLNSYSLGALKVNEASDWKKILRFYFTNSVIFSVVIITIILVTTKYLYPIMPDNEWRGIITTLLTLILLAPFLWALAFRTKNQAEFAKLWQKPSQRGPLMALMISRIVLALFYMGFLFQTMYSAWVALIGVLITSLFLLLFRNKIQAFYSRIELRFLSNLNQREREEQLLKLKSAIETPWDSHMAILELHAGLPFIGMTLMESKLRETFGINIAIIRRNGLVINVPDRNERLYPNDVLSVIGTDEQLRKFEKLIESSLNKASAEPRIHTEISLHHFTIGGKSTFIGKSIRDTSIRERTHGLVVGVERNGERILNPESDLVFEAYDTVWLVGDEKRIQVIINKQSE